MSVEREGLLVDWNAISPPSVPSTEIRVHDETLRDGLQSPSIEQPTLDDKLELLRLMNRIGIESACIGMPISSSTSRDHVKRLATEAVMDRMELSLACAARTKISDIAPVAAIMQETGLQMWAMAFVGTSPIRMCVEQWTLGSVIREVYEAVRFAVREGLRVCLVTEDTTRSRPEVALDVYATAMYAGAERICICDTVGYATPWGAAAVVTAMRCGLAERGFPDVGIDWHGHNDRGLAVANSLAAAMAGADRLHSTALGFGERAGNAPMEQLLANLRDLAWRRADLASLPRYSELASRACGVPIPGGQPFVGSDVYRTAAGVHAAAIRKALKRGDAWLADHVYAAIPASAVGREQIIEIGPGSGRANVLSWLESHGIADSPRLVSELQLAATRASHVLSDAEVFTLVANSPSARPLGRNATAYNVVAV